MGLTEHSGAYVAFHELWLSSWDELLVETMEAQSLLGSLRYQECGQTLAQYAHLPPHHLLPGVTDL